MEINVQALDGWVKKFDCLKLKESNDTLCKQKKQFA